MVVGPQFQNFMSKGWIFTWLRGFANFEIYPKMSIKKICIYYFLMFHLKQNLLFSLLAKILNKFEFKI